MDYEHLLVIIAALGAGAFAKGVTGMGLPLIALPVLTPFVGLHHAISILVIPTIATNAWQLWTYRGERRGAGMGFLPPLILASLLGTAGGTAILAIADERVLVLAVASTIFAYMLLRLLRPSFVLGPVAARRVAAPVGIVGGLFQGATGISGPINATFVHAMNLGQRPFVFALSGVFFAMSLMQGTALASSGIMEWRWLLDGLFALLPIVVFMPLGQRFGAYMGAEAFNRVIMVFLAGMGVLLVLDP